MNAAAHVLVAEPGGVMLPVDEIGASRGDRAIASAAVSPAVPRVKLTLVEGS